MFRTYVTGISLLVLSACGAQSPGSDPAAASSSVPIFNFQPAQCSSGELSESDILSVKRDPSDAPLADLSHYLARNATRAPAAVLNGGACESNTTFQYAAGVGDITGPIEGSMAGYVDGNQISNGLLDRQHARAYIFRSNCDGRDSRAVIVQLDIGLAFPSIRQGVLDALASDGTLGPLYDDSNLMVNASHSHSTAAGQSHFDAFHVLTGGHDAQALANAIQGIVNAIRHAHANLQAAGNGPIRFNQAELLNGTTNRSLEAQQLNPAEELAAFNDTRGEPVTTNRMMSLLKLQRDDQTHVGMLNFYAIHNTSIYQRNFLLAGDNKGYAAQRFEDDFDTDYFAPDGTETFLAGFMQADEGDASPSLFITDLSVAEQRDLDGQAFRNRAGGRTEPENALISGYKQYRLARDLYNTATEQLVGEVASQSIFIDMSLVQVDSPRDYPAELRPQQFNETFETCKPALGVSFAGGAEDGRGPAAEGQTCLNTSNGDLTQVVELLEDNFEAGQQGGLPPGVIVPVGCDNPVYDQLGYQCHAEKPIIFALGERSPFNPPGGNQTLEPTTLKLQIITLGNLAIIGLPWEVTTVAGRRLREAVLDVMQDAGIDYAVISGLSNGFIHYLTTREEYSLQLYEGASTVFGPWAQEAVEQELERLAGHIRNGTAATSPYENNGFRSAVSEFTNNTGPTDGTPNGAFGDVVLQPEASYQIGDERVTVTVRFRGGHPRNDMKLEDSFVFIERQNPQGQFETHDTDNDWFTRFVYEQGADGDENQAVVDWIIPPETPPGIYRIRHTGASAGGPYEGTTAPFLIEACPN